MWGLSRWLSGKESAYQLRGRREHRFDLGQADPLEEEMVTHSSIFAWKIPMGREASWAYSSWSQEIRKFFKKRLAFQWKSSLSRFFLN